MFALEEGTKISRFCIKVMKFNPVILYVLYYGASHIVLGVPLDLILYILRKNSENIEFVQISYVILFF